MHKSILKKLIIILSLVNVLWASDEELANRDSPKSESTVHSSDGAVSVGSTALSVAPEIPEIEAQSAAFLGNLEHLAASITVDELTWKFQPRGPEVYRKAFEEGDLDSLCEIVGWYYNGNLKSEKPDYLKAVAVSYRTYLVALDLAYISVLRGFYDYLNEYAEGAESIGVPEHKPIVLHIAQNVRREVIDKLKVDVSVPLPEPDIDWSQCD
jgi:hypothetical protein